MMSSRAFLVLKTVFLLTTNLKSYQFSKVTALAIESTSGCGLPSNLRNMSVNSHTVRPSASTKSEDNIVWVDMEMTGLDPEKDHVLEVACLVTDGQLNILAEGPNLIVHQPPNVLANMNEWSLKQHKQSGLTQSSKNSEISLKEAETTLLDFVRKWTPYQMCPLGGNTIYMDRMFLKNHMPDFEQHMHYRIIDVSTVKELCRYTSPILFCYLNVNKIK
uniref:Exonuclease domain-containing protein n=2 Tax=Graphocephala atropunctata TaxID=36148 RepID=A0A1B6KML4_9HEMI